MDTLLAGSAALSILHALIPSHWLPILAIGRKESWAPSKTLWVTLVLAVSHVASTLLLGGLLAGVGHYLSESVQGFAFWVAPLILIGLGVFYVYQHYYHRHFHLHKQPSGWGVIVSLAIAMFLSPCLEIEGYFLAAGQYGSRFTLLLAGVYSVLTIVGMLVWMQLALHGLKKLNWHALEHNAGLITGLTLIGSGVLLMFG